MNNPTFSAICSDRFAQTPIETINRILENGDNFFAMSKNKAVKAGNINNVKATLIVNVFGNGLTGNVYICLLTNRKSKYVPMKQERIIVITNGR